MELAKYCGSHQIPNSACYLYFLQLTFPPHSAEEKRLHLDSVWEAHNDIQLLQRQDDVYDSNMPRSILSSPARSQTVVAGQSIIHADRFMYLLSV